MPRGYRCPFIQGSWNRDIFQPSGNSSSCLAHSSLVVFLSSVVLHCLASWSCIQGMSRFVVGKDQGTTVLVFPCSSLLPGTQLRKMAMLCLGSPSLCHSLKSASRQKAGWSPSSPCLFPFFQGSLQLPVVQHLKTIVHTYIQLFNGGKTGPCQVTPLWLE